MTIKRYDKRNRVVLPRVGNSLPDDLLMPEMNAVEKTNRQADFAALRIQFFGGANDVHPEIVAALRENAAKI
jgi:hypothetical protein